MIDLGAWASESYVLTRPLNESDEAFQPASEESHELEE